MNLRAIGVYREPEFSPGKVDADAAILDSVLAELSREGVRTDVLDSRTFCEITLPAADLVLAMCQGERALKRLAEAERAGAVVINSALAIRNCYRDLLARGLASAGVPTPAGGLVATAKPLDPRDLAGVDVGAPVFVKRGDLHALGPGDVQRADGRSDIDRKLRGLAERGIHHAYVQQEAAGSVVKFYGVSGGAYFSALPSGGAIAEAAVRALSESAQAAAGALGLEAWGGDAVLSEDRFVIIDFNDWPSYSRVRGPASRAIAQRALALVSRPR